MELNALDVIWFNPLFLDEETEDEGRQGAHLEGHSYELSLHFDGGRARTAGMKICEHAYTCSGLAPHFRHHYIVLQGGTRLSNRWLPVWRHSVEMYLCETSSGSQNAALYTSRPGRGITWQQSSKPRHCIRSDGTWVFSVVVALRCVTLGESITHHIMFQQFGTLCQRSGWLYLAAVSCKGKSQSYQS